MTSYAMVHRIRTIDAHTAGEPLRLVVSGFPTIEGATILEKREFAAINIKPKELRIGFDLGDRPFDDTVTKSKLTGPMPRISHMVIVADAKSLNENMTTLLRESHSRTH